MLLGHHTLTPLNNIYEFVFYKQIKRKQPIIMWLSKIEDYFIIFIKAIDSFNMTQLL